MANKTPEEIMREAEALIEQTRKSLAATPEAYRDNGTDAGRQAGGLDEKHRAEAEALFRKDMEDIEREVAEEAARLSFANAVPRAGGPRKMRNMI